jgi:hypothetical protein
MTVKTFKLFCISRHERRRTRYTKYYVKLEELLQETILEETNELQLQVEGMGWNIKWIAAKDGEIAAETRR